MGGWKSFGVDETGTRRPAPPKMSGQECPNPLGSGEFCDVPERFSEFGSDLVELGDFSFGK